MNTEASSTPTSPLRLLVVGGAGYIGSHMVKYLLRTGCDVIAFDNLSTGHRDAMLVGEFVPVDLANGDPVTTPLTRRNSRLNPEKRSKSHSIVNVMSGFATGSPLLAY